MIETKIEMILRLPPKVENREALTEEDGSPVLDEEGKQVYRYPMEYLLAGERATREECDCGLYVGVIWPKMEEGTLAVPCSDKHVPFMSEFQDQWEASIRDDPQDRPAVEVADEILQRMSFA